MRFRRSAPIAIVVAIAIVMAATTFMSSRLFSSMTDSVEETRFATMLSVAQSALRDAENKALGRAELIADMPSVKKLFASGDRDGLKAELAKAFADQKARHGVDQGQFHTKDNKSFLRLHDPKTFGDDLTKSRPMVVAVNKDKVPLKGIAIARSGPAIFGIAVMTDEAGNHDGSFEIGMSLSPILTGLKTTYGFDLAFYVQEDLLRRYAKGVNPEKLGEQNRVGKFIRFSSTNNDLMAALARAEDVAVVNEPITYVRDVDGVAHGVVILPVNNSAGTPLGLMALSADFSASRAAVDRTLIWQAVLALIATLVLAAIVVVVLRGFLLRPLAVVSGRLRAIQSGEPLEDMPGADKFPEELGPYIELVERVRRRRQPENAQ